MDADYLSAKLNQLEGRVNQIESQDSAETPNSFGGETCGQTTHDPKGRKIWEGEWDPADHSVKIFVPDGAVIVGTTAIPVDAGGVREGDEVKVTAGVWYLHVHKTTATLDQTEHEAAATSEGSESKEGEEEENPLIFESKIIEISDGGDYIVNQFLVGAVVVPIPQVAAENPDDKDTKYGADEKSISLEGATSGDGTLTQGGGNSFHLKGFGKFTKNGGERGSYTPSVDETLDPYGERKDFAAVVRSGNTATADGNTIGYKKLTVKLPAPFTYKRVKTGSDPDNPDSEDERLYSVLIENPVCFIDGAQYTASVGSLGDSGTVYLNCKRDTKEGAWDCTISMGTIKKPDKGDAFNVKLYELESGKVKIDYRAAYINLTTKLEEEEIGEPEAVRADGELKPEDPPTVHAEWVEATEEKPKHLKFTFGIPPGAKGDPSTEPGSPGKSISKIELVANTGTKRKAWKLQFYRDGETKPIFEHELIGYYDDNKELIVGGVDTGCIMEGEAISGITLKTEKEGERTYSVMAKRGTDPEREVGTFDVKDGEKITAIVPKGVNGKDRTYAILGANNREIGTFIVRDGADGYGGGGDVDINVVNRGDHTEIYVDGDLAGSIPHGQKPNITSETIGKITYIKCDGKVIAEIYNGADLKPAEEETLDIVTGVSFAIEDGKLVSKVTKKRIKASDIQDIGTTSVDVCNIAELDVVTSEQYSTTTHAFTNTRKKIKVFGASDAAGQTPFTAEPLSAQ